jgi:Zn-dependent metalloprotease
MPKKTGYTQVDQAFAKLDYTELSRLGKKGRREEKKSRRRCNSSSYRNGLLVQQKLNNKQTSAFAQSRTRAATAAHFFAQKFYKLRENIFSL